MKKNLFMHFGMIVFVVLSMTGCPTEDESVVVPTGPKTLSGTISISPSSGVTVGNQLTAVYSGTETVTYQWSRGGTTVPGATARTYSPSTTGSYTVTVSAAGYESKPAPPLQLPAELL